MSAELSFGPEFFFLDGEPYDGLSDTKRPCSVWAAIEAMRLHDTERWADLARDCFACAPEHLTAEAVLERIEQTKTCDGHESPVEVYIDPEGWHRVTVHDRRPDAAR